jgi:hypothetical protein
MEVTVTTWIVAILGLLIMGVLLAAQSVALVNPRGEWTIKNVYGGSPDTTDPKAYFAFNRGYAVADTVFWGPIQIAGSILMVLGERWGFVLALIASVPFWYSAIPIFIWDRDMGFRENTFQYWVVVWGMFPAFGILEMLYCAFRLIRV